MAPRTRALPASGGAAAAADPAAMDFGSVISKASENKVDGQIRKRYSLSVKPPKKSEQSKIVPSSAVQAFLKRKEQELKKKDLVEQQRKEVLLAKRVELKHDRKARAMATRTKDNFRGYNGIPMEQKGKRRADDDEGKEQRMDDSSEEYYDREQVEDEMSETADSDGSGEFVEQLDEISDNQHYRKPEVAFKQLKRPHREPEKPMKEPKRAYKEPDIVTKVPEQAHKKASKSQVPKKPPMNFTDLLKLAEKKQFEPVELKPVKKVEEKLHTAEELKELEFLERKRQKQNDKMKSEKVVTFSQPVSSSKKEPSIKGSKSTNLAQGEKSTVSRNNNSVSANNISKNPKTSSGERLPSSASHKAPTQEKSRLGSGCPTSKTSGKTAVNVSAKSGNSSQVPSKGLKPGSNGSHSALSSKHTQKKISKPTSTGKADNASTRHERTESSNPLHSRSASSSAPERHKASSGFNQKQASSASHLAQMQSSSSGHSRANSASNCKPSRAGASDSTRLKEKSSLGTPKRNPGSLQSKSTNASGSIQPRNTGSMRPENTLPVPMRHGSAPNSGVARPGELKPKCTVVSETISSKNFLSRPSNGPVINRRPPPPPGYRPMMHPPGRPPRPPGPISYKRRLDDDDDEEYDSEMDDFIDDAGASQDEISKHIKEIFGYDRSKYRDESDYALRSIESSWKEQQKEEAKSLRLGIMEDAEELRKEEELRKRMKSKKNAS